MFVSYKNIICTLKWPSLKAKKGKTKNSYFGRIDFRYEFSVYEHLFARKYVMSIFYLPIKFVPVSIFWKKKIGKNVAMFFFEVRPT